MVFLRRVKVIGDPGRSAHPWTIAALSRFEELEFTAPVTFFVGENGCGKSTLLEAIALRAQLPTATGRPLEHDPSLAPTHALAHALRLSWQPRALSGLFLRVEDFFKFALETRQRAEAMETRARFQTGDSEARTTALAEKHAMVEQYGEDLHLLSHGECFLKFLQARCLPGGLHLLDEPEAALSPQRQLSLLGLIKQGVAEQSQFIVATHSPILLAFPGAQILEFVGNSIRPVAYQDLSHVALTRGFLQNPEPYLQSL